MEVIDPGHVYDMTQLGSNEPQRITFVKRGGGAVTYPEEWPGVQVQEVLRVLIDRTKYLNHILPCTETEDSIYYARMQLFMFEVRAWRRKQESVNRKAPTHDDTVRPRGWRPRPFDDVPFDEFEIEIRPLGRDGHSIV